MSVNYDERARLFDSGIEDLFRDLATALAVDADNIRTTVVAAYTKDLASIDAKTRVLDDIVAIAKSGDSPPEEKYRKVLQVLVAKGLIDNAS